MAETTEAAKATTERDYKAATLAPFPDKFFDGMPTDAAKDWVLTKAGTPYKDPANPADPHPLRAGLKHTHASDEATNIRRVTAPFPPKDYDKPLVTAGDYLKALDACSAVPAKSDEARKSDEGPSNEVQQSGPAAPAVTPPAEEVKAE